MFIKIFRIVKISIICSIFMFYIWIIPVHAFGPSSSKIYQGIDVSVYQGEIDYAAVKATGIQIVYIKSSEGSSLIDPYFEQNYINAKENGLYIGVYHYVRARTIEQARIEAQFFVSLLSEKSIDCMPAMDFETFGDLTKYEINQIGVVFLNTVKELSGKDPVVYSNTYTARTIFSGEVTNYPLWVAQYEVNYPTENGNWNNWVGWQYTSRGIVNGINVYVDRDQYTKDIFLSDNSPVPDNDPPSSNISQNCTTTIVIQYGDTLSELAIKYNTTVARLVELNNISNPNLIYAGNALVVPITGENGSSNGDTNIYIVRYGDTLWGIARRFNTTVNALVTANNIQNRNLIYVGQRIIIPQNVTGYIRYQVRYGDTLWGIARRFNTTISRIVSLNNIQNPNLIYAGDILRI